MSVIPKGSYYEYVQEVLSKPFEKDMEFLDQERFKDNPEVLIKNVVAFAMNKPIAKVELVTEEMIRKAFGVTKRSVKNEQDRINPLPTTVQGSTPSQIQQQLATGYNQAPTALFGRHEEFALDAMDFENHLDNLVQISSSPPTSVLQDSLLDAIEKLIQIKWPKSLLPVSQNYLHMGIMNGNPFALPLTAALIPPEYFQQIKHPMDLSTIKNRVKDYFYDDLNAFENDINLVISNALSFHKNHKDPMRRMAMALSKRFQEIVKNLRHPNSLPSNKTSSS